MSGRFPPKPDGLGLTGRERRVLVQRAYKTELDLNDQQVTACRQHAGAARWAYNWGLQVKQERYKATRKSPTAMALHCELNALKKTQIPWMYDVSKCAPQEALEPGCGLPAVLPPVRAQEAGQMEREARVSPAQDQEEGIGQLPAHRQDCGLGEGDCAAAAGAAAPQRAEISADRGVQILAATVSEQAGHWYVSLQVEEEHPVPENAGPVVGIDLGIRSLATLSDGEVIPNPRHLKRRLKKLKRLQRIVSRRQKGGKNRKKAVKKLAKLHRRIKNQRSDTLHQVTTRLAKTKSVLVIEDLHVSGMLKNHHLAQAIGDVGFYEFKRQLLYKASWYGSRVILADRWEPSSKTCSGCGWIDADLTLSDRTFHCAQCGLVLDRDLNAAINLEKLAGSSSDSLNARCEQTALAAVARLV